MGPGRAERSGTGRGMDARDCAANPVSLRSNFGLSASLRSGLSSGCRGRLIGAGGAAPAGPFEVSAGGGEGALKAAF